MKMISQMVNQKNDWSLTQHQKSRKWYRKKARYDGSNAKRELRIPSSKIVDARGDAKHNDTQKTQMDQEHNQEHNK